MDRAANRPWRNWYKLKRWQLMRERQLTEQPLCVFCIQMGDVEPAAVVDHVQAHKGSELLFWDAGNLQSLCKACHDGAKQRIDRGKVVVTTGVDGYPL